jgi:hypothetical protein
MQSEHLQQNLTVWHFWIEVFTREYPDAAAITTTKKDIFILT